MMAGWVEGSRGVNDRTSVLMTRTPHRAATTEEALSDDRRNILKTIIGKCFWWSSCTWWFPRLHPLLTWQSTLNYANDNTCSRRVCSCSRPAESSAITRSRGSGCTWRLQTWALLVFVYNLTLKLDLRKSEEVFTEQTLPQWLLLNPAATY